MGQLGERSVRRRFHIGYEPGRFFNFGQLDLRIVQGEKAPEDRRLDVRCPTWEPVKMALGGLLTDFFYENEQILYPPTPNVGRGRGQRGGAYYLDAMKEAAATGWRPVALRIEAERSAANGRPAPRLVPDGDPRQRDYELEPHPAGSGWQCPCCGEASDVFFGFPGDRLCRRCEVVRRYLTVRVDA
jgi:hypothetical protein